MADIPYANRKRRVCRKDAFPPARPHDLPGPPGKEVAVAARFEFAKCAAGARLPDVSRAWRAINREEAMKKLISALWLISTLATGAAWAQPYAPNDSGVTNGHWHLNSRDVAANKHILLSMG